MLFKEDGSFVAGSSLATVLTESDLFSAVESTDGRYVWQTVTVLKDGYYAWTNYSTDKGSTSAPQYLPAGTTIKFTVAFQYTGDKYQIALVYCGSSNPNS